MEKEKHICAECGDTFPTLIGWRFDSDWKVCENCYEMLDNEEEKE